MSIKEKDHSSLFQITISFLVLYIATLVVIFIPDFEHDLIRFVLLSSLFIISFLFQFYILDYKTKNERKNKNQFRRLLIEQDKTARLLIRRDRALSCANERLREIDKIKSEFVSVAAHQLRTPLSGIKWSLDMIAKGYLGPINEKQKSIILKTYETNDRMILLVNNLLNTERIESGTTEINYKKVDLKELIVDVLYYIKPMANDKNITINTSSDKDVVTVKVDSDKMKEVFQNIIENSVKYTKENGNIDIDMFIQKNNVVVSVSDNGIGIPDGYKDKVFEKFYRADNARKIKTEGSGLGLYVAKEIVERHGGTLSFESEEGIGTTFYISIPVFNEVGDND